jgi:hypothetical protein
MLFDLLKKGGSKDHLFLCPIDDEDQNLLSGTIFYDD